MRIKVVRGRPDGGVYRFGVPRSHVPLMKKLRRGAKRIKPEQLVFVARKEVQP